ncbi:MAG TPA: hypothetical protein VII57_10865 [Dehalococcoidia bacterium]
MSRSQNTGLLLMVGAVLEFLFFFYGVVRRSYVALALPVMTAMTALAALTFWMGWTMYAMEDEEEAAPVKTAE